MKAQKKAEAEKEARREYWREKLYSADSKAITYIVPDHDESIL